MKSSRIFAIGAIVVTIPLLLIYLNTVLPKYQKVTLSNGNDIKVETADNVYKQTRGLMYRKHMDDNTGMLFIFDTPAKELFWMKDTLIPLDFVWIGGNMKVVDITANVPPCKADPCKLYMPAYPAKYVLEINAGIANKQSIKVGDELKIL